MDNLTNKVLTLDNNKKYFILRQATYKSKSYYLASEVNDDKTDFKNEYAFLERNESNGKVYVKVVTDKDTIDVLSKNIKLED